jgi:hypothetical protein
MCCWTGRLLPCAAHSMDAHRLCAAFSRAVEDPMSMNGDGSSWTHSGAVTLPGRGAGFLHVGRYRELYFSSKTKIRIVAVYLFPSQLFLSLLWACFYLFFLQKQGFDRSLVY